MAGPLRSMSGFESSPCYYRFVSSQKKLPSNFLFYLLFKGKEKKFRISNLDITGITLNKEGGQTDDVTVDV